MKRIDPVTGINTSTLSMEEIVAALALALGRIDRLTDRLARLEARRDEIRQMGTDTPTAVAGNADRSVA